MSAHQEKAIAMQKEKPMFLPPRARTLIQRAVRLSQKIDGAPARCRKADCRRAGLCQFRVGEKGEGACHAVMRPHALERAAHFLVFAINLVEEPERAATTASPDSPRA